MQVITQTADPRGTADGLHDAAGQADETVLGELVALPESSQSLADLAAQWTTRLVAQLRSRAGGTTPHHTTPHQTPTPSPPTSAGALNTQSI